MHESFHESPDRLFLCLMLFCINKRVSSLAGALGTTGFASAGDIYLIFVKAGLK